MKHITEQNELHYYELSFYHDEDDNIADRNNRISYCIKTEIPPVIPDETALNILFETVQLKNTKELKENLTCVQEISESDAECYFDVDDLTERIDGPAGAYYIGEPDGVELCAYMRFETSDEEELKRIIDHHMEYLIDFDDSDLIKSVYNTSSYTENEHTNKLKVLRKVINDIRANEPDDDDLDSIQNGHELTNVYAEIANLDQALKNAGF